MAPVLHFFQLLFAESCSSRAVKKKVSSWQRWMPRSSLTATRTKIMIGWRSAKLIHCLTSVLNITILWTVYVQKVAVIHLRVVLKLCRQHLARPTGVSTMATTARSACPPTYVRGYHPEEACPSADARGHASIVAYPLTNVRGYATIDTYPSTNLRGQDTISACPLSNVGGHPPVDAYPLANLRRHASISAFPSMNVRGHPTIAACPLALLSGHASTAACPLTNDRGHAPIFACPPANVSGHTTIVAYPPRYLGGHATIWNSVSAFITRNYRIRKEKDEKYMIE